MKRLNPYISLALLVALVGGLTALAGSACTDNPVGRPCYVGADATVSSESIVASPALECQSRTCLHYGNAPAGSRDMCTAECETSEDCDKVPESPCKGGFACIVPVVVGPFCCQRMCVCEDYVTGRDGGIPIPAACDPNNPINECCNLPGRCQ